MPKPTYTHSYPGKYSVYKLTLPNGLLYFGKTGYELKERWLRGYSHNKDLQKAIDDCGGIDNIQKEILNYHITQKEASFREGLYIARFHTLYPFGYNLRSGGDKGFYICSSTREKMSRSHMGKGCKTVLQIDVDTGEIIREWPSISAASKELGINSGNISSAARGNGRTRAGGYAWKFPEAPADTTNE